MEIRHLHHLVALADRLNFARAAEEIGISQPALSRSIQALEQELGLSFFDRGRSGVDLSSHADALLEEARALIQAFDDFQLRARQTGAGEAGAITFGMAPLPARVLLMPAIAERISTSPNLVNDVVVRNPDSLWPMLAKAEIEFFVCAEGWVPPGAAVRAEYLGDFPLSLLARKDHPVPSSGRGIENYPIIVGGTKTAVILRNSSEDTMLDVHSIEDFDTLVRLAVSTNAILLSSPFCVSNEIKDGSIRTIESRKIISPKSARMMMYSSNRRRQSPTALSFKTKFRKIIAAF